MAGTAETADTATDPKTIPPTFFKNGPEVKMLFVRLLIAMEGLNLK